MNDYEYIQFRSDSKELGFFLKDDRSEQRLIAHYRLERSLAEQLRNAPAAQRAALYTEAYGKLFKSLPDHPMQQAHQQAARERHIRSGIRRLRPRLRHDPVFLEIGCGNAALSAALASYTAQTYALDVTDALIDYARLPRNLAVLLTTGADIPLPDASVDFVFSDQVMEHLHPQDAEAQVEQIHRVLKRGGSYLCVTPNRATGPHDISCRFGYEAVGLHLREYDSSELLDIFRRVGFRRTRLFASASGYEVRIPRITVRLFEKIMYSVPQQIRGRISRTLFAQVFAGLNVVATK